MPEYRIKEQATTRVWGGTWEDGTDPDDVSRTRELLRIKVDALNLHHPQGFVLQVWDRRKGWRDLVTT
jgi:hypothetical protein